MANVIDIFKERNILKQTVYEEELRQKLSGGKMTFYVGFDPTADSLHVGHFVQMMVIRHMLNAGHRAILLLGGGTGMVGDPTDKTQMRSLMDTSVIDYNISRFKEQMGKYIDFNSPNVIVEDNAKWLRSLNYIDFLREIGAHFSVNAMLTADCFKLRMEKEEGLSFLEFNYMIMQAYDFLMLNRMYGCELEVGGDDQWSNILAGVKLIRKKENKPAFAMTFALLENSEGTKMGKTVGGALWLDANKTPPYDFFQYWRNIDDKDTEKCFNMLTFLPVEEIKELTKHKDERMNASKEKLAYEVTKIIHGEAEAQKCLEQARAAFAGQKEQMPTIEIAPVTKVADLLLAVNQASSKGEAKRLIEGGGVKINEKAIEGFDADIPQDVLDKGEFILHKGKKVHLRVVFKG